MSEPTHSEFTTSAFVSIPLDVKDREWTVFLTLPHEVVEQFMAEQNTIRFRVCNSGYGPVGQPNETHYIALGRCDD